MTDILDLEGWTPTNKHTDGDEYVIEAEYTVPPKACTKCGNIGNLYKHGPKPVSYTHLSFYPHREECRKDPRAWRGC